MCILSHSCWGRWFEHILLAFNCIHIFLFFSDTSICVTLLNSIIFSITIFCLFIDSQNYWVVAIVCNTLFNWTDFIWNLTGTFTFCPLVQTFKTWVSIAWPGGQTQPILMFCMACGLSYKSVLFTHHQKYIIMITVNSILATTGHSQRHFTQKIPWFIIEPNNSDNSDET